MTGSQGGHLLILSGPPGCGKTTAARALAHRPGRLAVHLHADDFWGFVGTGRLLPVDPGADALNAVVTEAVAGAAGGFASGGFLVVVDCVFGPWRLAPFLRLDAPLHYVVLQVPPEEAIRRCAARGGDTLQDPRIIADLHRQFAGLGPLEPHRLDVEGLDPAAVVKAVEAALASGRFRLFPGGSAPGGG